MYSRNNKGFTIVELLIVVVIIGIIAGIVVTAYSGIQQRALDSQRLSGIQAIQKALKLYKADNGSYPATAPNPGNSGWEISTDPGFLSTLSNYSNKIPLDPINDASNRYYYRAAAAGSFGCPASLGSYYILFANGFDSQTSGKLDPGPCTGQALFTYTPEVNKYTITPGYYVVFGF